jgi:DNA-directed RNA polymerase specialized sigma24 family protein
MDQLSDALLWSLVKKFTKANGKNTPDDYMAEARATAILAIRKYDKQKNSSLEAFVIECVKNRLRDLRREDKHERENSDEIPEVVVNFEDDLHFSLTMKQLLNAFEYRVYFEHFVEDRSATEIAKGFGIHKRKVLACFSVICRKYALIEENHHRISTQRNLTSKWLEDSAS